MKKALLVLSLISSSLFSQTISYSFSDEFETLKKFDELSFFKYDNTRYASFYNKSYKEFGVQLFDQTFKSVITQSVIPLPEECKNSIIYQVLKINGRFFLVYHNYEKKNAKMFAYPFDKTSFSFTAPPKKMIDTYQTDDESYYKFKYSNDSTKSLVTFRCRRKERKNDLNKDVISFNLFDSNMDVLYAHDIEMPYVESDMQNLDYDIDSQGNIYFLISVKVNNSVDGIVNPDKQNENALRFELLKVNQKTNALEAKKLDFDKKYVSKAVLSGDPNGNLVVAGYYSNIKTSRSGDGVFVFRAPKDANGDIKNIVKSYNEFSKEFIEESANAKEKRKMEKKEAKGELEINNLSFKNIVFEKDGSMLITGEEEFETQTSSYANGKTYYKTIYNYGDVFLMKTDPTGKTSWCKRIAKEQSGDSKSYLSYFTCVKDNNYYFIFRDSFIEKELLDQVTDKKKTGVYLQYVKVDQSGGLTKKLLDIREDEYDIRPRRFELISNGLIVYHVRSDRKNTRILKLEIK